MRKVIVIGAGISGLALATKLIETKKFEVLVLEADNRIGGRIYSEKLGDYEVIMGAEWVHGQEGNKIFEKIMKTAPNVLNLNDSDPHDKFWSGVEYVYVTQNGENLSSSLNESVTQFMSQMEDDTLGLASKNPFESKEEIAKIYYTHFNRAFHKDSKISDAAMDWVHKYWNSYDCSDHWSDVSYSGTTLGYIELPGIINISWNPPASFSSFLALMISGEVEHLEDLKIPSWIKLNSEAIKIQYGSDLNCACVTTKNGDIYTADHIVSTLPLGVLKEKHLQIFEPFLSEKKQRAIKHIGFGCINKIYLEFNKKWWSHDFKGLNMLWTDGVEKTYLKNSVSDKELLEEVDGIPLWCRGLLNFHLADSHPLVLRSWASGRVARLIETLDLQHILDSCFKLILKFFQPIYPNTQIPEPVRVCVSKWNLSPFSRGSYSYRTVESEKEDVWAKDLATPIINHEGKPVICFAGEATDTNFYSSAHGAYNSGIREAERIIQYD